jgi:hypothetical protein
MVWMGDRHLFALVLLIACSLWRHAVAEPLCDDQCEATILSQVPSIAHRDGDTLFIHLNDGRNRVYEDHARACLADDAEHCLRYSLRGYDPEHSVVTLAKTFYEGFEYELLSLDSGESIVVPNEPRVAPNGQPIWAIVDDNVGYGSGETQLVTLKNGAFHLLGKTYRWICTFKRWDEEIALVVVCSGNENESGEFRVTPDGAGTLNFSTTGRVVSDEEYRSLFSGPPSVQ